MSDQSAELAVETGATENKAPGWTKDGAYVYRLCTPDHADTLISAEAGIAIINNLLDRSIRQIPILTGIIGHDHPGGWNWDGPWPYWDRVTFRGRDWATLHDFMQRVKDQYNTAPSFHVNITDVDGGLRDYPETRDFFEKLVATESIYRRDGHRAWPDVYIYPAEHERHLDPPYVPREIPEDADTIEIFALVNYKNFWDCGLAKKMIDDFYSHLPYAPPILYLDVLMLSGSNFNTGFPDGPLGGSEETQLEGVRNIVDYLRSKGTGLATEGDRPELRDRASYGWLHCQPGYSSDDYSYIAGTSRYIPLLHVAGNTGCFVTSPIASTPHGVDLVRNHYARLLAGLPGSKPTPGVDTWHIAYPVSSPERVDVPGVLNRWYDPFNGVYIDATGEYDMPGAADPFRGDWADLVNNFYLTGIQELYHIGKGNVRTDVFNKYGVLHLTGFGLVDSAGRETIVPVADCVPADQTEAVRKSGRIVLERPLELRFKTLPAGNYRIKIYGNIPGCDHGALNIYVNGRLERTVYDITFPSQDDWRQEFPLGEITLEAGDNTIAIDAGPIYMRWSDGTTALWSTPYLRKGFKTVNGDVTFADDYDRMWPDTWSGEKKIYFFSWDGTRRTWKLPQDWASVKEAILHPLTPDGRGEGISVTIDDGSAAPELMPQVPYVLIREGSQPRR